MSNKDSSDTKQKQDASVSSDDLKPANPAQVELEEQIEALTSEVANLKDQNTRLVAEHHNLGTRLRREFDTKKQYAITSFAKEILDIGDILATGLENCKDKESEHYQGMAMTLDKFYDILRQHDITKIDSIHQAFNHDVHEALMTQPSDEHEPGTVLQVIQEGYQFKDRVLRPAKVIVSKKVSQDS